MEFLNEVELDETVKQQLAEKFNQTLEKTLQEKIAEEVAGLKAKNDELLSEKKAAQRAYKRAGISDPKNSFDVIEISDQYAFQQPMWMEGLGLVDEDKTGKWIDESGPENDHVNYSGGMLAGNPLILGGLIRVAEAYLQLTGQAENHQVPDAKTALAHGVMGPAGQFHTVITLSRN